MNATQLDQLLNRAEAAEYLGLSQHTLMRLEARGAGPTRIQIGRSIRYRAADLAHWIESRARSGHGETRSATRAGGGAP